MVSNIGRAELESSGVFGVGAIATLPELHRRILGATITNPANWVLTAGDFRAGAAWSAGAAAVAAGNRLVRFLSLATVDVVEISDGPLAVSAPWTAIALLAGAICTDQGLRT